MPAVNPGTGTMIDWWEMNAPSGDETGSHASKVLLANLNPGAAASAGPDGSDVRDLELGFGQYFALTDSTFNFGDTDFSIVAWIKPESLTAAMYVAARGRTSTNQRQWLLQVLSSGTLQGGISSNGSSWTLVNGTFGAISTGTWYLVALVHDATANLIKVSLNAGAFATAAHSNGALSSATQPMGVGCFPTPTQYWDGMLCKVGIWAQALSVDHLTYIHNAGAGAVYADFVTAGGVAVPNALAMMGAGV